MPSLRCKIKRVVLKEMKSIYYSGDVAYYDWMGYKLSDYNYPTYHHIVKASSLRQDNKDDIATLENGAYLGCVSHNILHIIEQVDYDLFLSWNYIFRVINNMGIYPIDDVWRMISLLQSRTDEVLLELKFQDKVKVLNNIKKAII